MRLMPMDTIGVSHKHRTGTCGLEAYGERGARIRRRHDRQPRDWRVKVTDHQRLMDGIGTQHDRGRVLLLLGHPEIEPTNNREERGLRGAVIARKVSHCSKNEQGARVYEAMRSATATHALRGPSVARALADLIQGMPMPAAVAR